MKTWGSTLNLRFRFFQNEQAALSAKGLSGSIKAASIRTRNKANVQIGYRASGLLRSSARPVTRITNVRESRSAVTQTMDWDAQLPLIPASAESQLLADQLRIASISLDSAEPLLSALRALVSAWFITATCEGVKLVEQPWQQHNTTIWPRVAQPFTGCDCKFSEMRCSLSKTCWR